MTDSLRDALAARAHPFVPLRFTRRTLDESLAARPRLPRRDAAAAHDPALLDRAGAAARSSNGRSAPPAARRAAPTSSRGRSWRCPTPRPSSASATRPRRRSRRSTAAARPQEWIDALAPLGTDEHKPHLTDAPWVVVLFRQAHGVDADGAKRTYYYTPESCGIAAGFFIAAVHMMGLVTLTHTPSPMGFLGELLERPANEKAMLVMPVGYPAPDAQVPDIARKPLDDIAVWR